MVELLRFASESAGNFLITFIFLLYVIFCLSLLSNIKLINIVTTYKNEDLNKQGEFKINE